MFRSIVDQVGMNAVAALLTGMGEDGARGLLALRQLGAHTVVQDEASSVVWGMPGAAVRLNAAERVLPLDRIGTQLLEWTQ
jgi:two-component system, chemotaxis family, protein-glutamate methylesterase/glutaminase